jgi:hypothetical protein
MMMTTTLSLAKKKRKNKQMKRTAARSGLLVVLMVLVTGFALAQSTAAKSLQGKVFAANDSPLSGAIVYLQDSKTNSIRSFISTDDGSYRFGQLAPDTDYEIWAQYKSAKSPTKSISSYDRRNPVIIDLHIKAN